MAPLTVSRSPLRAAAAVAAFGVAAASAWSAAIPVPPGRVAAVAALAAVPALLAAASAVRAATATIALAVPGTVLLAGLPIGALVPRAWPQLLSHLGAGATRIATGGGPPEAGAWSLAAVMLASGALWLAGSLLAPEGVATRQRSAVAFALLLSPWLVALSRTTPDHAAWQGAIVLLGGVLWFPCPHRAIPLAAVAALLSVPVAHAVGPRARWFGFGSRAPSEPPFRSLDAVPTYGPLTDRRTGAPMLEVTSAEPALWRMQVLDEFDGAGWTVSPGRVPELPQPAAQRALTSVRVMGLRNYLVVSPGRVDRLTARARITRASGEAWRVAPLPGAGFTYQVTASSIHVSAGLLARDRARLDPRSRAYTRLGSPLQARADLGLLGVMLGGFAVQLAALQKQTPVDGRVVALARRLAAGARTEWDVVARVEHYLLGGGRFRYTTQVPQPGSRPLVDFLLRTHAGYCQHFAGAAALLLRLAGVPTRVVVGFATGVQTAAGSYTVRDVDAHEWIEVYFQDYGWVPFNPTPSTAAASVASGLDPLTPGARAGRGPSGLGFAAALAAVGAAGAAVMRRHRSRRLREALPPSLERVASRAAGPVGPATTLRELADMLARIGPRTAALARDAERARFAPHPPAATRHPRLQLVLALVRDLGPRRAVLIWGPLRYRRRPAP